VAILARFAPFGDGWPLVVQVMLNSSPGWYDFAVHTGPVHTAISDEIIDRFGLEPTDSYSLVRDPRTGRVSHALQYRLESILLPSTDDRAVGTPYVYAVRLDWVHEIGVDGILGTQWLRQEFGRLAIDLERPSIELHRRV
jgi:hypothetical protein